MERRTVALAGGQAQVWTGGSGEPLLLLHGGWAGAAVHWSPVWEALAERYRVVAPELPGIAGPGPRLATYGVYGLWLDTLLDALGIDAAWTVGNSFGATVAWRFAAQAPQRCRGLVMVNGIPAPAFSIVLREIVMRTFLRRFARARLRRAAYSPAALRAAFPETARIPDAIRQSLTSPQPWQVENMLGVVMASEMPCPPPRCPTLLLWGEADRLDKVDAGAARRLADALPGSHLVLLPGAGHLPQLDKPGEFVAALDRFIASRPDRGASRP